MCSSCSLPHPLHLCSHGNTEHKVLAEDDVVSWGGAGGKHHWTTARLPLWPLPGKGLEGQQRGIWFDLMSFRMPVKVHLVYLPRKKSKLKTWNVIG